MSQKPRVLFVCLGNICRSPLAEAAFRMEADKAGLAAEADSAGTGGWHTGDPPDPRAQTIARRQGVEISGMRARQVNGDDFSTFTHMLAVDHETLATLERLRPAGALAELGLLLDHAPGRRGEAVTDPYYLDDGAFSETWAEVSAAARGLVQALSRE